MTEISPLQSEIKKLIQSSGPMPVWRYMELCLTHPEHGYYVSRDPLGREGDFTTAPEVSQMFGELLGLWAASVWKTMGSPPTLRLVELGPGRGTMMADALRALRVMPPLYQALTVHLVEINPVLREKQRAALSSARSVEWHTSIDDVPKGPAIILANEYFDALPIHQMVKHDSGWHERTVEIDPLGKLAFGAAAEPTRRFDILLPPLLRAAPNGAVFEWRPDSEIMKIARRIREQDGAALIIDYGHVRSDAGDTFQAIARHSFSDPLKNPGQADVTAHVDFQALASAAEDIGVRVHGPVTQGDFLKRLGIETRALTLMANATNEVSEDVSGALKRLIGGGRGGMGSMFKVLAISEPNLSSLAGFSDHEPSDAEPTVRDRAPDHQAAQEPHEPSPDFDESIREQPSQEQNAQAENADARGESVMKLGSPLLAAIPGLRHAFFTRDGGVSQGIYAGLNGGIGSKDDPGHVAENRRRMAQEMGVAPEQFLTVFQIHSPDVAVATKPWDTDSRPRADAIVTSTEGLAIGVTTADCGPVLFVDPTARVIGAAHAGWKGAFTGVLEATIAEMEKLGAQRRDIVVAIGPLIRQSSYEVGHEFVERFLEADAEYASFFVPSTRGGHAMFDLAGFIRMRLENAGITLIDDVDVDTYSDQRFYSYRRTVHRSEPDYARHVHAIALEQT